MFKFKQFIVHQDKTAMKVGTDGVLLGAWVDVSNASRILDIGTGTGLIALMLAQRAKGTNALITALDIDKDACDQARHNVEVSSWRDKIFVENIDLQNYTANAKFDLIISNPPFFIDSQKSSNKKRDLARHNDSLSFDDLMSFTSKNLTTTGKASFIIPYDSESAFILIAEKEKLYPSSITRVRGTKESKIKRSLLEFTFVNENTKVDELVVEISRHNYTPEYTCLTKDFYLKM